jgi:hypothetical protein
MWGQETCLWDLWLTSYQTVRRYVTENSNLNCVVTTSNLQISYMFRWKLCHIQAKCPFEPIISMHLCCGIHRSFRHVRINTKKWLLASSCPSVRPSASRLPLDGFSWNLILGPFTKVCWEIPNLLKIGHFQSVNMKPSVCLHSQQYELRFFAARQQCKGNPVLLFRGNIQRFYTTDSYM